MSNQLLVKLNFSIIFSILILSINVFAGQGIILNGTTQHAEVALPNNADFNNLTQLQIIWRARQPANQGYEWAIGNLGFAYQLGPSNPRIDIGSDIISGGAVYMTPTDYTDIVCKLQFNTTTAQGTFETWKPDGSGYVLKTFTLVNSNPINLGGQTLGVGGNTYGLYNAPVKFDYLRMIKRYEATGIPPTAAPPTGVNYLFDYEFEGNSNDSSGRAINLSFVGSPTYENTP